MPGQGAAARQSRLPRAAPMNENAFRQLIDDCGPASPLSAGPDSLMNEPESRPCEKNLAVSISRNRGATGR